MYKGLTTLFTVFSIILFLNSANAEAQIESEITASASILPVSKTLIQNSNIVTLEDRYLISKRVFFEESKIVEEISTLAKNGEPSAQHQLGEIYKYGKGVTKSDIVALMWYIVSEQNGHKNASKSKEFTEQYMAFDQIALAYKMAEQWKEN